MTMTGSFLRAASKTTVVEADDQTTVPGTRWVAMGPSAKRRRPAWAPSS